MKVKISKIYLLLFIFLAFFISSGCTHNGNKANSVNKSTFRSLAVYPAYAGWENVNLERSLDDGFAVYGCREMILDNTKVGSVDFKGEDNLEFLGNVGGMGEVIIRNGSYVSGDLTYSPEGTYSTETNSVVKGLTYSWGVTNCPWWDYDRMVAGGSFNDYPEYLTVSTKVTLATGSYHFNLLDVEGGELYGRGVTIFADELNINGGSVDVGLGLIFSKKFQMSGGKLSGRVYSDEINMTGGIVEGKLVGKDVFVNGGEVYYNGDILCHSSECRILVGIAFKKGCEFSSGITTEGGRKLYEMIDTSLVEVVNPHSLTHRCCDVFCSCDTNVLKDSREFFLLLLKLGYSPLVVPNTIDMEGGDKTSLFVLKQDSYKYDLYYLARKLKNLGYPVAGFGHNLGNVYPIDEFFKFCDTSCTSYEKKEVELALSSAYGDNYRELLKGCYTPYGLSNYDFSGIVADFIKATYGKEATASELAVLLFANPQLYWNMGKIGNSNDIRFSYPFDTYIHVVENVPGIINFPLTVTAVGTSQPPKQLVINPPFLVSIKMVGKLTGTMSEREIMENVLREIIGEEDTDERTCYGFYYQGDWELPSNYFIFIPVVWLETKKVPLFYEMPLFLREAGEAGNLCRIGLSDIDLPGIVFIPCLFAPYCPGPIELK